MYVHRHLALPQVWPCLTSLFLAIRYYMYKKLLGVEWRMTGWRDQLGGITARMQNAKCKVQSAEDVVKCKTLRTEPENLMFLFGAITNNPTAKTTRADWNPPHPPGLQQRVRTRERKEKGLSLTNSFKEDRSRRNGSRRVGMCCTGQLLSSRATR